MYQLICAATVADVIRFQRIPPAALDVLWVLAAIGAMCTEMALLDTARPSVVGVAAIVLASLPLVLRERAPVWALSLSLIAILAVLSTVKTYNTVAIPAIVCSYYLASQRGRRDAGLAAAVALPLVVAILTFYSPHPFFGWDTAKNLGLVALPLAWGVAAHDRRAYTTALLERAESAERSREQEARRRVSEERLRIARNVHDVVAHAMVAINVQAGVGAHLLEQDDERTRTTLLDIKRVSGEALSDLRSMLGILRYEDRGADVVAPIHPTQRLEDLDTLCEGLSSVGIDVTIEVAPSASGLPASISEAGYRIVQEAVTNVIRHVGPTNALIRVTRFEERLMIEVEDDGNDAPAVADESGSGNGLRGMRERAVAVGGTLEAGPRDSGGWRVAARLPFSDLNMIENP